MNNKNSEQGKSKVFDAIMASEDIPDNYKYYWGYQWQLGEEVVVPYIEKLGCFKSGDTVTEIGSAEGGVLAAFVQKGAAKAIGTDIVENRLEMGDNISKKVDLPIEFLYHDIITEPIKPEWEKASDLVILRDVIEHLDDTYEALNNIKKIIKPGGYLFVTFPPYHSPFGGHQHTVQNRLGKIPYIHLLPNFLFQKFIASGVEGDIGEVKRLQKIRLTPKKFTDAAEKAGYEIYHKDFYLLRPVFKMKFGLPSLRLTPIAFLPLVKQFFSLEAAYVLKVKE